MIKTHDYGIIFNTLFLTYLRSNVAYVKLLLRNQASSLILPRPSTFIGMLLSALIHEKKQVPMSCLSVDSWKSLLEECYIKLLDELGVEAIRGPFLVREGKLFIPLMLGKRLLLLDYYQAEYHLISGLEKYSNVVEQYFSYLSNKVEAEKGVNELYNLHAIMKLIERYTMSLDKDKYIIEPHFINRTGIHLKSRDRGCVDSGKVAKVGYIYTAKYVAYPLDAEFMSSLYVHGFMMCYMISSVGGYLLNFTLFSLTSSTNS